MIPDRDRVEPELLSQRGDFEYRPPVSVTLEWIHAHTEGIRHTRLLREDSTGARRHLLGQTVLRWSAEQVLGREGRT